MFHGPAILAGPCFLCYNLTVMKSNKNNVIVMMGGQGVGKGTFSKMLCERHDFNYIETGAILRNAPADSEIGKTIAAGNLIPDEMTFALMREKITPGRDIILDGFPRTLAQAKWLVENYANDYNIHVLYLNVPEEILVQRINKRIREGGRRRDDASPDVIRRRLDTFRKITIPAIEWLRTAPRIRFSDIDAHGDARDNFAEILVALKS